MSINYFKITTRNDLQDGVACVVDLDNILHRGFDRRTGLARPQAILDAAGFSNELKARGVDRGTICRNWKFSQVSERYWGRLGFAVSASESNCDSKVIEEAKRYSASGSRTLVLVSGDGDYCDLVDQLHTNGVFVEVWARRSNASRQLTRAVDRVRYIDNLVLSCAFAQRPRAHNDVAQTRTEDCFDVQHIRAPQLGIRGIRTVSIDQQTLPLKAA